MLLADGIEHVARAGDMREINLSFDLIHRGTAGTGGSCRRMVTLRGTQISAHLLGFMLFQRAGMRLFLGHSHDRKCIENRFTFNFQLPCQIVNSNLTHPPRFPPSSPRYVFILTSRLLIFPNASGRVLFRSARRSRFFRLCLS